MHTDECKRQEQRRAPSLYSLVIRRRRPRRSRYLLPPLLALGMSSSALAASIEGTVESATGEPLDKVPVCLRVTGDDRHCSKIQSTDRNGRYRFNGVKDDSDYAVVIFQDDSATGRRFERYRTYVWTPLAQPVSLASRNASIELAPFRGKFNFSNFQRSLTLTSSDFPELGSMDLLSDYVILKVFIPATSPDAAPETIFLGRVTNVDTISVAASLPLSATSINYQIYSASLSIDGSISLAGGQ